MDSALDSVRIWLIEKKKEFGDIVHDVAWESVQVNKPIFFIPDVRKILK